MAHLPWQSIALSRRHLVEMASRVAAGEALDGKKDAPSAVSKAITLVYGQPIEQAVSEAITRSEHVKISNRLGHMSRIDPRQHILVCIDTCYPIHEFNKADIESQKESYNSSLQAAFSQHLRCVVSFTFDNYILLRGVIVSQEHSMLVSELLGRYRNRPNRRARDPAFRTTGNATLSKIYFECRPAARGISPYFKSAVLPKSLSIKKAQTPDFALLQKPNFAPSHKCSHESKFSKYAEKSDGKVCSCRSDDFDPQILSCCVVNDLRVSQAANFEGRFSYAQASIFPSARCDLAKGAASRHVHGPETDPGFPTAWNRIGAGVRRNVADYPPLSATALFRSRRWACKLTNDAALGELTACSRDMTPAIRCLQRVDCASTVTDTAVIEQVSDALSELKCAYRRPSERIVVLEEVLQIVARRRVRKTTFGKFVRVSIERWKNEISVRA